MTFLLCSSLTTSLAGKKIFQKAFSTHPQTIHRYSTDKVPSDLGKFLEYEDAALLKRVGWNSL
jgi:hypothetical protein